MFSNEEMIHNLQSHWSKVCSIFESNSHYLRLPAMRLIDGGSRNQPRDAIIDYAIGLESLLTGGEEKELAYKFALRGATILSWDEGRRREHYNSLRSIYKWKPRAPREERNEGRARPIVTHASSSPPPPCANTTAGRRGVGCTVLAEKISGVPF
jgi:hypothetical protein